LAPERVSPTNMQWIAIFPVIKLVVHTNHRNVAYHPFFSQRCLMNLPPKVDVPNTVASNEETLSQERRLSFASPTVRFMFAVHMRIAFSVAPGVGPAVLGEHIDGGAEAAGGAGTVDPGDDALQVEVEPGGQHVLGWQRARVVRVDRLRRLRHRN